MGTYDKIGKHLVLALQPLREAVSSQQSFQRFIYRLGWNINNLPPSYSALITNVDEAVTSLEALSDDPTIAEALEVFEKVKNVYAALKNLNDVPPGVSDGAAFINEIKDRIFEILLVDYLKKAWPFLFNFFRMTGVIKPVAIPREPAQSRPSFIHTQFNWNRIPELIAHPDKLPEFVYGWGTPDFNFELFSEHLTEVFLALKVPVQVRDLPFDERKGFLGAEPEVFGPAEGKGAIVLPFAFLNIGGEDRTLGLSILGFPSVEGELPGIIIKPELPSEIGETLRLREDVNLRILGGSNISSKFGFIIRPGKVELKYPFQGGASLPDIGFGAGIDYAPASTTILLGDKNSTRIEIKSASFDFRFTVEAGDPNLALGFDMKDLALIIDTRESDGFLQKIIGKGQTTVNMSLGMEWSGKSGLKFKGGGGFEISLPSHISLGPISIEDILIRLTAATDPPTSLTLQIGATIKGNLGPVQFILLNTGLKLKAIFADGGNAGPFDFDIGFKPPNGAGLSIDAGGMKGGGILNFDPDKKEYFGAFEIEFKGMFSLKVFGIINTQMPDGSDGFSLLIIVTAEFTPIQLGFGFTLNGVGGLLGVNRTTRIEVLKEGIKTNAIKSILFPEDVVTNINRIVSDIKQVFPPQNDHFLIAPMAKIGWGTPTIITLELGLLIEIPVTRLVILGVLKALLPREDAPLLKLQVNFIGDIDFENKSISFDAWLYDSKLLTFTLTGQMALRIAWGDKPMFVLSVGGFHPAFKEIPAGLEGMQRITISLLNKSNARITIQNYFAITSNTVQFGARAELFASKGSFNIYGFIGYDVLFQFDPFKFIADFKAAVALRRNESVIMGISVSGTLAGPSPWDAKGEASVSFFFFSISIPFHESWGDSDDADTTEKADLLQMLTDLIADNRSWKADIPSNNNLHVSIRQIDQTQNSLVIHPFGILTFSERLVPLGIDIDKFGNKIPKDTRNFEIKTTGPDLKTEPAKEQFAPANFIKMTDSEKLARPSFELMKSGFKITGSDSLLAPMVINKSVTYEFSYLGRKKSAVPSFNIYGFKKAIFKANTKGGAISKSSLSYNNKRVSPNAPEHIAVEEESFVVANVADMKLYNGELVAGSYTEALQYYNELVKKEPALKGQVQVLSQFELNPN